MKQLAIAIVSPVLNEETRLPRMLASVEAQTLPPCQHLIIEGGSTDHSPVICREYAMRAPFEVKMISQRGKGLYGALNEGINASQGEIVGLLHANDMFADDDILQRVSEAFSADEELDMVYGDIVYITADGSRGRKYSGRRFSPRELLNGFMPPHPSIYIRKELWDRVGQYREDMRIASDFEWLIRSCLKEKIKSRYLPLEMVKMSSDGISSAGFSRLWRTPHEKWLALRDNGYRISPLRLIRRYFYLWDK